MRRAGLVVVAAAAGVLLGAPFVGGGVAEGLLVVAAGVMPFALVAVAVGRRVGWRLGVALAGLGGYYAACLLLLLLARGRVLELPWIGGLPFTAAVAVYGVFLVPLPVVAMVFARSFPFLGFGRRGGGR